MTIQLLSFETNYNFLFQINITLTLWFDLKYDKSEILKLQNFFKGTRFFTSNFHSIFLFGIKDPLIFLLYDNF